MRQTFLSQGLSSYCCHEWTSIKSEKAFWQELCSYLSLFFCLSLCSASICHCVFFISLSLSDYLSLHSQQSVFVYLSVIKTLTIFLLRVESAHACLPFILCVSLYLSVSLLCLSVYVFLFVYLSQLLFPWKKPLSVFTKIFLKLSRNRRFWTEEGNSL